MTNFLLVEVSKSRFRVYFHTFLSLPICFISEFASIGRENAKNFFLCCLFIEQKTLKMLFDFNHSVMCREILIRLSDSPVCIQLRSDGKTWTSDYHNRSLWIVSEAYYGRERKKLVENSLCGEECGLLKGTARACSYLRRSSNEFWVQSAA